MFSLLPTSSPPDIIWRWEKPLAEDLMKSLQMAFLSVVLAGLNSYPPAGHRPFQMLTRRRAMGIGMRKRQSGKVVMLYLHSNSQPLLKFIQSKLLIKSISHAGYCAIPSKLFMVKEKDSKKKFNMNRKPKVT